MQKEVVIFHNYSRKAANNQVLVGKYFVKEKGFTK